MTKPMFPDWESVFKAVKGEWSKDYVVAKGKKKSVKYGEHSIVVKYNIDPYSEYPTPTDIYSLADILDDSEPNNLCECLAKLKMKNMPEYICLEDSEKIEKCFYDEPSKDGETCYYQDTNTPKEKCPSYGKHKYYNLINIEHEFRKIIFCKKEGSKLDRINIFMDS